MLQERVSEAQRHAAMEMRSKEHKGKGGKRVAGDAEAEDARAEPELQRMIDMSANRKKRR
jgi:hypothetical protein